MNLNSHLIWLFWNLTFESTLANDDRRHLWKRGIRRDRVLVPGSPTNIPVALALVKKDLFCLWQWNYSQSSSFPCVFSLQRPFLPSTSSIDNIQNRSQNGVATVCYSLLQILPKTHHLRNYVMLQIVELRSLYKRRPVILQVCSFVLVPKATFVQCSNWSVQQIRIWYSDFTEGND